MLSIGEQIYENIEDAILSLRGAVSEHGSSSVDFRQLGEALALDGRVEEAIEAYRSALDISEDGAGFERLAQLLMRRNHPAEARLYLDKAAAIEALQTRNNVRLAEDYNELADVYFSSGDLAAAIDCHEMAQKILPGYINAFVGAALKTHIDHVLGSITPAIASAAHGGPTYHAATVVWGDNYCRHFLECCIPSLLAPGNIPFLAGRERILFIIYSTQKDIEAIDFAPQFKALQKYAEIMFVEIPAHLIDLTTHKDFPKATQYTNTLQLLSAQHYISTILARNCTAGALYVPPDWIYSDNCLRAAHEMIRGGKEIFVAPILLAGTEGITQALKPAREEGGEVSVAARDLCELAVSHLHSSWRQFIARGDSFEARQIPAWMLWPFGDSGLVMHAFHWSVFLISAKGLGRYRGERFWTIDHRFLDLWLKDGGGWERVAKCGDTSDFVIIALEDEDKDYAWADEQNSVWDIDQIAAAVTPGMDLLSLSQANHLLFREKVIYDPVGDNAGRADAVHDAEKMVATVAGRIMNVSVGRA